MAGTIDLLQRCYTGLEMRHDVLYFNPVIPAELGSIAFDIRYRGYLVHLEFTTEVARGSVDLAEGAPITVDIQGLRSTVVPGQTLEVKTAHIDPHASASSAPEADADAYQVASVASAPTPSTGVGPPCSLRITARKRSTAWTVAWARTDGNMSNACCAPGSSA